MGTSKRSKSGLKRKVTKGMTTLLSISLLTGAMGCGNAGQNASQQTNVSVESQSSESLEGNEETSAGSLEMPEETVISKIDDQGKPVWDFDEFVNAQWLQEHRDNNDETVSSWDDENQLMDERIREILETTDLEGLSEEDDLYKAIVIYRSLMDKENEEQIISTIKKHLAPIEKVKKLGDLYALYQDEEYDLYNFILNFDIVPDGYGHVLYYFSPIAIWDDGNINDVMAGWDDETREKVFKFTSHLGYSEKRTIEILTNAAKIDDAIKQYKSVVNERSLAYYIYQDQLDQQNVTVPVIDILHNLYPDSLWEPFVAPLEAYTFFNELYVPENVAALRDYFIFTAMFRLGMITQEGCEYAEAVLKQDADVDDLILYGMMGQASDVLAAEYQKRYLDAETMEDISAMAEEVMTYGRATLGDSEWLTAPGKEAARRKIYRMEFHYGMNESQDNLSGVKLTDNALESYISMRMNHRSFLSNQTQKEYDDMELFGMELFAVNAFYNPYYNCMLLTNGFMSNELCSKDAKYEERLAYLGITIAHEMSHAYDPRGSKFDGDGYYEPWMTEEEEKAYLDRTQKIEDFFDGMEIEYGQKLDGSLIKSETFADLMAMECCLRMLEKQENPDYDLFFRSYAMNRRTYYTEEGMKTAVKDTHLPAKQRINYILAQFDKFYEIYDIDESSPYFVPKENRLPIF